MDSDSRPTPLKFSSSSGIAQSLETLIAESRREICILSHSLPNAVFTSQGVIDGISQLVRRHKLCRVRILLVEPPEANLGGHPLIKLQQRLPSKISCRRLEADTEKPRHNFILGDDRLLLMQHEHYSFDGVFDAAAALQVRKLLQEFEQYWECQSSGIADIKQLSL